ncbi:LysR substrate-binding domain-containing protein [soil metagenome]
MINLKHLEVFNAVMRAGSVTGAARALHVTQPAVSAVVKHLETRLGMQLFERQGGRLTPTEEAVALMPDLEGIFGRVEALERLAQDLAGGRLGSLSIAAASPIANGYLAEAVAAFLRERPGVRVALQTIASPQVLDRVANREVVLGVAYEPVVSADVVTQVLSRATIGCILRDDHPLAALDAIDVQALEPYPLITYLPQALLRPYIDQAFSQAGISPKIAVQVGLSITGMALAYQGAGIALVETQLLDTLPLPGLVARQLTPAIELNTLLLTHRQAAPSILQDEFIALLRRHAERAHQKK